MIELNINDMKDTERHSSKGNQLKWNPANTETWYKADYIGYEGLTEYMVSHLLMHSTLSTKDFVLYDTEILRVGNHAAGPHGFQSRLQGGDAAACRGEHRVVGPGQPAKVEHHRICRAGLHNL